MVERKRKEPVPRERQATVRDALRHELRGGPLTARELSGRVGVSEKDVVFHLVHLQRSLKRGVTRLKMEPAACLSCGFIFQKRDRLTRPGSCPECDATHIDAPRFWIDEGEHP